MACSADALLVVGVWVAVQSAWRRSFPDPSGELDALGGTRRLPRLSGRRMHERMRRRGRDSTPTSPGGDTMSEAIQKLGGLRHDDPLHGAGWCRASASRRRPPRRRSASWCSRSSAPTSPTSSARASASLAPGQPEFGQQDHFRLYSIADLPERGPAGLPRIKLARPSLQLHRRLQRRALSGRRVELPVRPARRATRSP